MHVIEDAAARDHTPSEYVMSEPRQTRGSFGSASHTMAVRPMCGRLHIPSQGGHRWGQYEISQGMQMWLAIHCMGTSAPERIQHIADTRPSIPSLNNKPYCSRCAP